MKVGCWHASRRTVAHKLSIGGGAASWTGLYLPDADISGSLNDLGDAVGQTCMQVLADAVVVHRSSTRKSIKTCEQRMDNTVLQGMQTAITGNQS